MKKLFLSLVLFIFLFLNFSFVIAQDKGAQDFDYKVDQFADIQILRYQVPGFESLPLKKKQLLYYLYEASLSGRDIIYAQNYKHNLTIRRTLEAIQSSFKGDKNTEEYQLFLVYAKRVWFSNGIHHHYSAKKILPDFSKTYFASLIKQSNEDALPLMKGEDTNGFLRRITPIIFDPSLDTRRVNLNPEDDLIATSANNYYDGVTQKEVEDFYAKKINKNDNTPISYGLNSRLVKENGKITEKIYKVDGLYGEAIKKMVFWLEKAITVAENDKQKLAFEKLVAYFKTGDLKVFDEYNIAWVQDVDSDIDLICGFIEVYGDAMGYRGAYEAVVQMKDAEASKRMEALAHNAQWFEDNSPLIEAHKKKKVKGVSYKVITTVVEAGDAAPSTPIGINLPNSSWIRKEHGSKSVSLGNIKEAYNQASSKGALDEFAYSEEEKQRAQEHRVLAAKLHTALHEVIGHASGQLMPGVGTAKETLKNYASALEEGRADLVALYFLMDEKMIDIGIMPSLEVGKAEYDAYIRNGLMLQLRRLNEGEQLEESHMRNRQLVAAWAYEKGKKDNVIEKKVKDGKTYFVINDYKKLRSLFGDLLREIQRIKSEGDYEAGKKLIETYAVNVDQDLLKEVKRRYSKLKSAPYGGFIQPKLTPTVRDGKIVDITISYPEDFVKQMIEYGRKYSFLPNYE